MYLHVDRKKHYFVKTDCTFSLITDWKKKQHLEADGSNQVTLPYISGNCLGSKKKWSRMYDFSWTAGVVLRYMMLRGAEILDLHNPHVGQRRNRENIITKGDKPHHVKLHLAKDKYDAQWLSAHFDMLYPHFYLEYQLRGIKPGDNRSIHNKMLVIDTRHHIIWKITVSLEVEMLERTRTSFKLQAVPKVIVKRYTFTKHSDGRPRQPEYPSFMEDDD